jgi:hypothetical protein
VAGWSDADGRGCAEVTCVSRVEMNGHVPDVDYHIAVRISAGMSALDLATK